MLSDNSLQLFLNYLSLVDRVRIFTGSSVKLNALKQNNTHTMFFSNDRTKLRRAYFDIWQKTINKQPLEPMEQMISQVITEHPEYHVMFANEQALHKEFFAENEMNPFMHMGLHLAIREQIATNRPEMLATCYNTLCTKHGNSHDAEHQIMECLTEMLWNAQQNNTAPDELGYISCLKKLANIKI